MQHRTNRLRASGGHLLRDIRGVTYVEYVVLLCLVTLVGAVAVSALGYPLIHTYRYAQLILGAPVP